MKKTWATPEVEELVITETANGQNPSENFDDTWVSINGLWYRPGDGEDDKVS